MNTVSSLGLSGSPTQTSIALPSPMSEMEEARFYYAGLPSAPVLVARTGTTPWEVPTDPEGYPKLKELRVVGNHALSEVWEDDLALKLHALLDSMRVKWTSTDVVRIGYSGEASAPVILWIGVMPSSLSGHDGVVVAFKCRELLVKYDIADVDVEIRESVVRRSAGPKLLAPTYSSNPTASIREPISTTLGFSICALSTPWAEGTAGFFITEGENTERLLLVTARHVVFTSPDKSENNHFEHKKDSQHRRTVTLFSDDSFNKYFKSIGAEISRKIFAAQFQDQRIQDIEGKDDPAADRERQKAQVELVEARRLVEGLSAFYSHVTNHWAISQSRALGHVILSPPIGVGCEGYKEDWAVIEIDASKVDETNFKGNAIDLGTQISPYDFTQMMRSNGQSAHPFTYPSNRLLMLKGTISDKEMRHPRASDRIYNQSLTVIKRGKTTGLTIGRANNIFSYTRHHCDEAQTTKEWAIFPLNSKSGAFSDRGDSGSVVADGLGRIGGLVTGGAGGVGATPSLDITYATPISFLLKCMHDKGLRILNVKDFDVIDRRYGFSPLDGPTFWS